MQFDSYNIDAPGQRRVEVEAVVEYLQQLPQGTLSDG
ncbi:hypothetical protein LYNGBM3L_10830 [Moorena producens 3L]|uniref:Uncharacterized protein n=1 Tax=Moorena producens 3L TaxID=489825 RepID=F4XK03_9CYAN|nr:hypothetical protein LYNGBM3L_10830 [Moorena producens 3L]